jgi:hypothetical protein
MNGCGAMAIQAMRARFVCCPRAANGHAAAPPSRAGMHRRRLRWMTISCGVCGCRPAVSMPPNAGYEISKDPQLAH